MSTDGFESVQGAGITWNPKQTGSKKEGNFVALEANEKSHIIGYYLGTKTNIGRNNSNIHELQLKSVGDKAHLDSPANEGDKISVWGSGVLDSMVADNVAPGQLVMITWQGLQQPKKEGGNTYHGWDLGINKSAEPIKTAAAPGTSIPEEVNGEPEGEASTEEDDDLPF